MSGKEDAEEVWASSADQTRRTSEPTATTTDEETQDRQAAIRDGYDALADGDLKNVVSTRDDGLAAILYGLDHADELTDLASKAADLRGVELDSEDVQRSGALSQLARAGIAAVDESIIEDALEAYEQHQIDQVDEF